MGASHRIKLALLLALGSVASCSKPDRAATIEPGQRTEVERAGQAFREQLSRRWRLAPAQSFIDMSELCRETFNGKTLKQANAMMRAAGQSFDLAASSHPAALVPPGTTPYAGGIGLHSSLISGAGLNVIFYVDQAGAQVKDVSCGIKEVSL